MANSHFFWAGLFLVVGGCVEGANADGEDASSSSSTSGAVSTSTGGVEPATESVGSETADASSSSTGHGSDASSEGGSSGSTGESLEFPNEILDGIYRLDGVTPELPYADLAPLGGMVEGAEIVGLGESTHTADAFLAGKARLTRYLIEEEGFRVIGLESPWLDMRTLGAYVQTCDGSPQDAVTEAMFGVWADVNMVELATWLCAWNSRNPDDRVEFVGWDLQQPWHDGTLFRDAVSAVEPAAVDTVYGDLESCNGVGFESIEAYIASPEADVWSGSPPNEAAHGACLLALPSARAWLEDNAAAVEAWSSADDLFWLRIALRGIESWENSAYYVGSDRAASLESRDLANAETILDMMSRFYGKERMVLWAHNAHLFRGSTVLEGGMGLQGAEMTGTRLAQEIGEAYVAVGLTGYDIDLTWFTPYDAPPADSRSGLERQLHELGEDYLLVDLHHEPAPLPRGEAFEIGHSVQGIESMVPSEQFDALLFVDESPGMTPAWE